jgi:hypothetical protein
MTYMRPLKVSARVSAVARGMLAMVMMESATGSYLNESVESTRITVGSNMLPPPV